MLETTPAAQSSLLTRTIQREIEQESPVRAVLIFGPRRIGKTTLLRQIIGQNGCRWFNGDIEGSAADLRFQSQGDVFNVLSQAPNIVIDEAHKIADIGTIVKVLVDANETLQNPCRIYLTSSSSFYLSTLKESALGRVVSRKMWPFSLYELAQRISWGTVNTYLERFLVYGLMPMVCLEPEKARSYLEDYCEGYLLRDFYEQESVKHPQIVRKILVRLAHYVGSEISYDRLAQEVGISRNTVEDYVERMQARSIIQICQSFSRNLANEMKKGKRSISLTTVYAMLSSVTSKSWPAAATPARCGRTSFSWNAASSSIRFAPEHKPISGARPVRIPEKSTSLRFWTEKSKPSNANSPRRPSQHGMLNIF